VVQKPIELILLRQLAARLALPVLLVDTQGTLVYRNPRTDEFLGVRPGEFPDEMPLHEIAAEFRPMDTDGRPMPGDQIPVLMALRHHLPKQVSMVVHDRAGTPHPITSTAFPLEGQGGAPLGAMSFYWETRAPDAAAPGDDGGRPASREPDSQPPAVRAPPIEMLLLRQVASYLAMPMFVVDADGELVYYNEPAEALLGRRYEETGQMPMEVWGTIFTPTDSDGQPLPPEQLPLAMAVQRRHPTQGSFWILGLDGVTRRLVVSAIPLDDSDGRPLGAVAIFWEG
jgi:PAS domain-containing protein